MKWLSLLKYLLEAGMNWYAEWKAVLDKEKEDKRAEEMARDLMGDAFKPKDAAYTETR